MKYILNDPSKKTLRQKLRRQMPPAEIILWTRLKGSQLGGFKIRRQYGIGSYVVDFYCTAARLAIELDGESHYQDGAEEYDRQRQQFIETRGHKVIRFTNGEIYEDIDRVLKIISQHIHERKI